MQSHLPASQKILFISDVHLGAFTMQKNQQLETDLIKLISYAEEQSFQIALLGDLFDYWIEYPGFTPSLGEKLLRRFQAFNQNNKGTLFITGNHDNWTLGHFTGLGFDVEPDSRILHINGQKILLLHGDATGNDISNLTRPVLHRIIRNELFLKIYRAVLPPRAGLKVMQKFSQFTRLIGGNTDNLNPLDNWTKKVLNQSDIDYIICGHDHSPRCLNYNFGTYFNAGAFCNHKTMVAYNNGRFELVNWNSGNQELIPFQNQEPAHE